MKGLMIHQLVTHDSMIDLDNGYQWVVYCLGMNGFRRDTLYP